MPRRRAGPYQSDRELAGNWQAAYRMAAGRGLSATGTPEIPSMKTSPQSIEPLSIHGFRSDRRTALLYGVSIGRTNEGRVRGLLPRHREVPASAPGPYAGPGVLRPGIGASGRGHRERAGIPPQGQSVHRRRALSDDRQGADRGRRGQLQHRPGRGPQPLFGLGRPHGVHVPALQARLHQQSDDPQALRGVRVRGQGLPHLQQGGLLGHRDPQEDGLR